MSSFIATDVWAQQVRDHISIVGSSTVYPFATVVAEKFGKTTRYKTPKVESTGSGGGLKLFCAGLGVKHPDIVNSSRRIKQSEIDKCHTNGVKGIVEVKIGYGGIVLANSKASRQISLTRKDIFLALAREVPAPGEEGKLVRNSYKTWKDVNKALPSQPIVVLGPPPTSGTRDAFVELAMEGGCRKFDWISALKKSNKKKYQSICHSIREDGVFVEVGENDNLIVQKLDADKTALGIFGFSFLDQNADKVRGALVDGVEPTFENIASGKYPISRPLYFYVKAVHIGKIPGIKEYLSEFSSAKAWGDEGYLADKGMIPMSEAERQMFAENVRTLKNVGLQ